MVVSWTGMYKDRFAAGRPLPTTRSEKGAISGRSGEPQNDPPSRMLRIHIRFYGHAHSLAPGTLARSLSQWGGCISFSLLSCGLLRLGLRVRRASLGDSAALRPSPSRVGSIALARSCIHLVLCPTSGATVQLPTEGPLEWLVGVGPAMGSTAHGSRRRRYSGASGSLGAR